MWTPKRVLLLVLGLVAFSGAYMVYSFFLGRVDGLPPLPPAFRARVEPGSSPNYDPPNQTPVDQRLQMAFGEDCQEIHRTIRLEVRTRGLVLASDEFKIEDDGRVKLKPFSCAVFGKDKGDGHYPEINTVRSDVAYLTFDRPISNPQEIANHKIVGAELVCQVEGDGPDSQRRGEGGVRIVNNRQTPQRDDDLTLFTPGPVYFQENLHQIWTREPVVITDEQTKPKPTIINAIGMDVYLSSDTDAPGSKASPAAKHRHEAALAGTRKKDSNAPNVTGVKAIVLRSDVAMHLWVDSRSGFLGSNGPPKKTATGPAADKEKGPDKVPAGAAKKDTPPSKEASASKNAPADKDAPANKSQVVIKTQGPFVYDMLTDHARFDISQHPGPHPNNVEVSRQHTATGDWDQLICDHLELQFVRDTAHKATANSDRGVELQIDTAHAWGNQITITSDSEALTAIGNDLVYNARSKETTLCGNPEMVALKDGNEITATELVMIGTNEEKETQQARAKGPGHLKILNRQNGLRPQGATWKDMMYFAKDGEYDLLTLLGDATFEDQEHAQCLQADRLKVWLEPRDPAPPPGAPAATSAPGDDPHQRRPHHVEAVGHVVAKSAEFNSHDSDRLTIWFKDVQALPGEQLPNAAPAASPAGSKPAVAEQGAPDKGPTKTTPDKANPAGTTADASSPPKKPYDIQARSIEAHVLRAGTKNELDKVNCDGSVHVTQEPATPQDKGVDIVGDSLLLLHFPEGHVMTVTGDLAKVELDKMTIGGPEVNIDQKDNKAWVVGMGFMRMPSDANFHGEPVKPAEDKTKEPVYLTVHWNRDMFFDGNSSVFHGGVQAEQENGRMTCQELQVFLDRFVSLKQAQPKNAPAAKVQKLVCDKSVRVEERKFDPQDSRRMIGFNSLISPELVVDNEANTVHSPGPGTATMLSGGNDDGTQPGAVPNPANGNAAAKPGSSPAASPGADQLKLTRINFWGSMFANNNTRTAIFYNNVEVVNIPSDDPNLTVDLDHLPASAMYLRCNQLKVYSRKQASGKTTQEMEAHGRASVQSQNYWGRADVIKFDESKDLLVFEAAEGNLATLNQVMVRGAPPRELKAKKIYYWRQTGAYKVEQGVGVMTQDEKK